MVRYDIAISIALFPFSLIDQLGTSPGTEIDDKHKAGCGSTSPLSKLQGSILCNAEEGLLPLDVGPQILTKSGNAVADQPCSIYAYIKDKVRVAQTRIS